MNRYKLLALAGNVVLWTILICTVAGIGFMMLDQITQASYFSAPKMEE